MLVWNTGTQMWGFTQLNTKCSQWIYCESYVAFFIFNRWN